MEDSPSPSRTMPSSSRYVSWDEVAVYREGGSRVFHYYLKRSDGKADLAVVGKEKMPYRCVLRRRSMIGVGDPGSIAKKLRSRTDVIDWLNSVVSGPQSQDHYVDGRLESNVYANNCMSLKLGNSSEGFLWVGSPWTCRKMRRHYPSFQRRGVKISVHDFVYVLSEDNKRLVAYIEDMFEDSRGNKMVVIRWFHKVDEVGLLLSRTSSDREIFFSLCLQDLNIECIDGMATVLGPQHFEKYMNEVGSSQVEPFVCYELFDDDEIKPFDITRVKGYWNQQIFKHIFPLLPPKPHLKPRLVEPLEEVRKNADQDSMGLRPRKKQRLLQPNAAEEQCKSNEGSAAARSEKPVRENPPLLLSVGCAIEVLSQDSGIRGCWFRASIIKISKDKVKVRYQDVVDVTDEANKLEEWISTSKLAASDELGLRFNGRRTIRPLVRSNEEKRLHAIGVGTVVDAWWCDGWWEGIVVREEHGDRFHVFFPGEKRDAVFPLKDLRPSQEWIGNRWVLVKDRPEVLTSMVQLLQRKHVGEVNSENGAGLESPHSDTKDAIINKLQAVRDVCKDTSLANLKWKSSGKRTYRRRKAFLKEHPESEKVSVRDVETHVLDEFLIRPSFKVDRDKCKFISDSLFNHSVVPPLSSLVMSR
ncbi:uncharacterized protein LOC116200187 isoform X2 [Punica granatum]|uniref:Uncharacterized protein LOC116200187 isoform X2 n=2 Tax=Punica granatum TaxID=22663 RepID=A0A6P8CXP6_PUNGR|nr:uncharacterized protein LOC116200187 isoform X2 [Punica granatum]